MRFKGTRRDGCASTGIGHLNQSNSEQLQGSWHDEQDIKLICPALRLEDMCGPIRGKGTFEMDMSLKDTKQDTTEYAIYR